ncbi:MAG: hypothetical protein OCU22_03735 [Canidatus Methanoxibalbensis ujae]|nr:hypothetical protein [Candidatus Methanoxibalbensis ujae]
MPIWQYYAPCKRREFGGKMYELHGGYESEEAQRVAKELRKQGYYVRVVKKEEDWFLLYKRKKE